MYSNYTTQSSHSPDNSVPKQKGWLAEILDRQANGTLKDPDMGNTIRPTYDYEYTSYMDPPHYSSPPQVDHMPHYQPYDSSTYYPNACQYEPPTDFSSSQFMPLSGQPNFSYTDYDTSFDPSPYESNYYGLTQKNYMDSSFNFPNDSHNDDPSFFNYNNYDQTSLASKLQDLVRDQQTLLQSMNQTEHNIIMQQMEESNNQILESSARMTQICNGIQESLNPSHISSSFDHSINDDTDRDSMNDSSFYDIGNSLPLDMEQSHDQWNTYDNHEMNPTHNSPSVPIFSSPILMPDDITQLHSPPDHEPNYHNTSEEVLLYQDESYIISSYSNNPSIAIDNYKDELNEDETLLELSSENIVTKMHESSLESTNHQLDLILTNLGPHYIHDMHILPVDTYLAHDPYLREMSHQHSDFCLPERIPFFDALLHLCAQTNSILLTMADNYNFSKLRPCYIFSFIHAGTWPQLTNIFKINIYLYTPPPGVFPLFLLVYDLVFMH